MGFLIFLLWAGVALWVDGRLTNFHIRKALKALEPGPKCRACLKEITGRIHDLGHGANVCGECYLPIALEAGLVRPDWWDKPTTPEGQEVPAQLEAEVAPPAEEDEECTWVMSGNTECVCPDCIEDTQEYWDRQIKAPGGNDDWFVKTGKYHTAVGNLRPLAENFRPTGGSKCDTCGNYHDYGTEHLLSSRYGGNGGGTHRRSVPAAELSPVVWCANCDKRVNECVC